MPKDIFKWDRGGGFTATALSRAWCKIKLQNYKKEGYIIKDAIKYSE